jgi:membrane protein DedA with SNARE-associated domain
MAQWVMDTIYSLGYIGIVLLMFLENVFPPIPSEVIMPLAGFMVTQGRLSFTGIVIAGTLGSVLGALPLYYFGRLIGEERLYQFFDRYGRWLAISRQDTERAKRWFERHGALAVLLCRLVPALRSLISIPAGIARMNVTLFLIYTTIGAMVWTTLLAYLGYFLGTNFRKAGEYLDIITWIVIGTIVLTYIYRVIRQK